MNNSTPSFGIRKGYLVVGIALLVICMIVAILGGGIVLVKTFLSRNNSEDSTNIDTSQESGGQFPPPIPGLTYSSIASHMRKIGITCDPMQSDAVAYSGACEGTLNNGTTLVTVDVYSGDRPDDIYLLQAFVFQFSEKPDDKISEEILSHVALIPYENAEPEKAQAWVEANVLPQVEMEKRYNDFSPQTGGSIS